MVTVEYGVQHSEVVLLLHGGGLSWWNYQEAAMLLQNSYHVVLPVLDGHAESGTRFTSIESNAKALIAYIDERFGGSVLLLGGLSLGGQVAAEMLAQRKDICRYAVLESVCATPSRWMQRMIGPAFGMSYGLIKQSWFSRWQFRTMGLKPDLYSRYYEDSCKITKDDMIAFMEANSAYGIKPSLKETQAKVSVLVGGGERRVMLVSARLLHEAIPDSSLTVLKGYGHGGLSINHAEEYAARLMALIALQASVG